MHVTERFLRYVSYDTQSSEDSATVPTTDKQKVLGAALAQELSELGLHGAKMDEYGYVYGWLPATVGCEGVPCLGLIAHMDTSPSAPGANNGSPSRMCAAKLRSTSPCWEPQAESKEISSVSWN